MFSVLVSLCNSRNRGIDVDWQSMEVAPRETRLLGRVAGRVRFIRWGKVSHVPIYGWVLVDQGPEDCELCEPSGWMHLPDYEPAPPQQQE